MSTDGPDFCELDRFEEREALDRWARRWLHHLHVGCRRCWTLLEENPEPPINLDEPEVTRLILKAQSQIPQLFADAVADRDRAAAERFVDRLERLSPEHQKLLIANSAGAYSASVCEVLVEKSKAVRLADLPRSWNLAELGLRIPTNPATDSGRRRPPVGAQRRQRLMVDGSGRLRPSGRRRPAGDLIRSLCSRS